MDRLAPLRVEQSIAISFEEALATVACRCSNSWSVTVSLNSVHIVVWRLLTNAAFSATISFCSFKTLWAAVQHQNPQCWFQARKARSTLYLLVYSNTDDGASADSVDVRE